VPGDRQRLLRLDDRALAAECDVNLYKASGAGGQKRNKTSSAVRMRHASTGILVTAHASRSQSDNRAEALRKLRTNIALDLRERPTESEERMAQLAQLIRKGPLGRNSKMRVTLPYVQMLAEVLDIVDAFESSIANAAEFIGVSTSSLGKLLQGDNRLARRVAELRTRHGLRPLQ
tara:strand:- start:53264 stop:53788 length:525 start_codon:yes stop_codon:yes gene_type:complete